MKTLCVLLCALGARAQFGGGFGGSGGLGGPAPSSVPDPGSLAGAGSAAFSEGLRAIRLEDLDPTDPAQKLIMDQVFILVDSALGLGSAASAFFPGVSLRVLKRDDFPSGAYHVRLEQLFAGVRVDHADVLVHSFPEGDVTLYADRQRTAVSRTVRLEKERTLAGLFIAGISFPGNEIPGFSLVRDKIEEVKDWVKQKIVQSFGAALTAGGWAWHPTNEQYSWVLYWGSVSKLELPRLSLELRAFGRRADRSGGRRPYRLVEINPASLLVGEPKYLRSYDSIRYKKVKVAAVGGNERIGQRLYTGEEGQLPKVRLNKREDGRCYFEGTGSRAGLFRVQRFEPGKVHDHGERGSRTQRVHDSHEHSRAEKHDQHTDEDEVLSVECGDIEAGKKVNGAWNPSVDVLYALDLIETLMKHDYGSYLKLNDSFRPLTVHVLGPREDNAAWNGHEVELFTGNRMFHPLVQLETVAHEIGHAITESSSLMPYYTEPGGIDESFCDIFSKFIQYRVSKRDFGAEWDWQVGVPVAKEGIIRSMEKPKDKGDIDNIEQFYNEYYKLRKQEKQQWVDPHTSSGILNRAFADMVAVEKGKANERTGLDVPLAFDAFYIAQMYHWDRNTQFHSAAAGVLQSMCELQRSQWWDLDIYKDVDIYEMARSFEKVGMKCSLRTAAAAEGLGLGVGLGVGLPQVGRGKAHVVPCHFWRCSVDKGPCKADEADGNICDDM